jgi:hypothetical protein
MKMRTVIIFGALSLLIIPALGRGQCVSVLVTYTTGSPVVLEGFTIGITAVATPECEESNDTAISCIGAPDGTCIVRPFPGDNRFIEASWLPRGVVGTFDFTFLAVILSGPNAGQTATRVVTVTVVPNQAPNFLTDPSQLNSNYNTWPIGTEFEVQAGHYLFFNMFADDPDDITYGDMIYRFDSEALPSGMGFSFENRREVDFDGLDHEGYASVYWMPVASQIGTHSLVFYADDTWTSFRCSIPTLMPRGRSQLTVTVHVLPSDPPYFTAPAEVDRTKTANAGNEVYFAVEATDPDGDIASIVCENPPPGAEFTGGSGSTPAQGYFMWTPQIADGGTHQVTFVATDNVGTTTSMIVTIKVETDQLYLVDPAEQQLFTGTENPPVQTPQTPVVIPVKAVAPLACPSISVTMETSIPIDPLHGPFLNVPSGNPAEGSFRWEPQVGQAGDYTVTFTAAAAGYDPIIHTVDVHIDPYAADLDEDGIPDALDVDFENYSDDFALCEGTGTIDRGNQVVYVAAGKIPGQVYIWTAEGGGPTPASVAVFGGKMICRLGAAEGALVWCGSAGVKALLGAIDVEFIDVLGQHAYTTLDQGNAVVFESTNYSFTAPATNLGPVTVTVNSVDYVIQPGEVLVMRKDDLVGTWDGQGVYYRNSETTSWVKLASPATILAEGDLNGGGLDDLIGIWPSQGGVWLRSQETGGWTKLASTARAIALGDMNGDGRVDLLGTWDGQGVYYRDSTDGTWVKMASPADLITTGDLDGDDIDDLIGIWPSQGGVWVKYSESGSWAKLSSTARDIAAGDANGDGRDDLIATWDGQGVYYRDTATGAWVKMASQAEQVACGDVDGDIKADLIGIWPGQGGVWVKYSKTGAWARLSSSAQDITSGKVRPVGSTGGMASMGASLELPLPMGGLEMGLEGDAKKLDLSDKGPGGRKFTAREEGDLVPGPGTAERAAGRPGPGEPGFIFEEQKNLYPGEAGEIKKVPQQKANKAAKKH